jgi:hypothetical protein
MPVSEYTPSIADVAGYIRARTKTRGGAEAGTFNPEASPEQHTTRPTAEQVQVEIDKALGEISNVIGADIPEAHREGAASLVALRAAMFTELTYWPEQINTGRSTYPQLLELFKEARESLYSTMGIGTDTDGGPVSAAAGYPSYGGFPTTGIGMDHPW